MRIRKTDGTLNDTKEIFFEKNKIYFGFKAVYINISIRNFYLQQCIRKLYSTSHKKPPGIHFY